MSASRASGPFSELFASFRHGAIDRRTFIMGATALGMTLPIARFCADSVAAQEATPEAQGAAPAVGTENQTRGEGGELRILQWQAPSHLNPHTATGDKDGMASMLVVEPLMYQGPGGVLIPNLVKEVPTVHNGFLSEDLTTVTYNLREGVVWSDGTPFTSADVVFTWEWVLNEENAAIYADMFKRITSIEAPDELTAIVHFDSLNPTWYDPHSGGGSAGSILPKHILEGADAATLDSFAISPIGTGPFVVESFTPNDQVTYIANENFREPGKPFFSRVLLKGGGDAASAGRAVIETGEYDFAWNLALEPEVLRSLEGDDKPGVLLVSPGFGIERININFSDPYTEVDGQYSEMNTPHPIFSDIKVREALTIGINRQQIADNLFFGGDQEPAIANILSGIPSMDSPNTTLEYNPDRAKQLLDEAGWVQDGDKRSKDGNPLTLKYSTTVSSLRQKIQQIVKSNLEDIGIEIQLDQVDSAVFFDSNPENHQSNTHFYCDLNMFTSSVTAPPPVSYMVRWYAGADRENVAQKSNGWAGRNFQRYINDEYDAVYEQAEAEGDMARSAELFIQLNDILFFDWAVIPLVRAGSKSGVSRRMLQDNLALEAFEFDYWNIANWRWIPE